MVVNYKRVKLYPYRYKLDGIENDPKTLLERFSPKDIHENLIKLGENSLVLVIDSMKGKSVYGQFLKLRSDAPKIINKITGKINNMTLKDDEDVLEQTLFIMNTEDRIILGQYNFHGIRYFVNPLIYYLNNILGVNENSINLISDLDTYKHMKDSGTIKKFTVGVAKEKMKALEKLGLGLSTLSVLMDIGAGKSTEFEITIKRTRRKNSGVDFDKAIDIINKMRKQKGELTTLNVATEDAKYDLLNNNFMYYTLDLPLKGRSLDIKEFYERVQNFYADNRANLLSTVE